MRCGVDSSVAPHVVRFISHRETRQDGDSALLMSAGAVHEGRGTSYLRTLLSWGADPLSGAEGVRKDRAMSAFLLYC